MKYLESKALRGGYANKALPGAEQNKAGVPATDGAQTDPLETVDFASPAARTSATEAGLTAEDFKRKRRGSDKGFTKDDVERIAGNRAADEDAQT